MKHQIRNSYLLMVFLLFGCYTDDPDEPSAFIETYRVDPNDSDLLIRSDTLYQFEQSEFANLGNSEFSVVWTGERLVSFSGQASFIFTSEVWDALAAANVPEEVINQLRVLEGNTYDSESRVGSAIFSALGEDEEIAIQYDYIIKASALIPSTDRFGNDSTRYSKNHSYEDFLVAREQGLYNVTGISMDQTVVPPSVRYRYDLAGRYTIHLTARNASDFGEGTKEVVVSKEIIVIPRPEDE